MTASMKLEGNRSQWVNREVMDPDDGAGDWRIKMEGRGLETTRRSCSIHHQKRVEAVANDLPTIANKVSYSNTRNCKLL